MRRTQRLQPTALASAPALALASAPPAALANAPDAALANALNAALASAPSVVLRLQVRRPTARNVRPLLRPTPEREPPTRSRWGTPPSPPTLGTPPRPAPSASRQRGRTRGHLSHSRPAPPAFDQPRARAANAVGL
ncbi:hypothetical protein PUNSTDRAFT_139626, partial [Punctularia strigosozonata HHB-11173 SS5]